MSGAEQGVGGGGGGGGGGKCDAYVFGPNLCLHDERGQDLAPCA